MVLIDLKTTELNLAPNFSHIVLETWGVYFAISFSNPIGRSHRRVSHMNFVLAHELI